MQVGPLIAIKHSPVAISRLPSHSEQVEFSVRLDIEGLQPLLEITCFGDVPPRFLGMIGDLQERVTTDSIIDRRVTTVLMYVEAPLLLYLAHVAQSSTSLRGWIEDSTATV